MTFKPERLPNGKWAYQPNITEGDLEGIARGVRDWLVAFGVPETRAWFHGAEAKRSYLERRECWGDWQQRVWYPRMAALATRRPRSKLTPDELDWLINHFEDANDPMAQQIAPVLSEMRKAIP